MNPDNQNQPAPYNPHERIGNDLSVMQNGETVICDISRHPIGIISIYVMSGLLLLFVAALVFGVGPHFASANNRPQVRQIGALVLLVMFIICTIYSFISTKIYWGNRWVVTSDSLTQISQTSLFNRQSSQLSLANLEDISAVQNGPIAHMFNYGIISAETAAATDKFTFFYCPNPNLYAQKIVAAREAFEQSRRGEKIEQFYHDGGSNSTGQPMPAVSPYPPTEPAAPSDTSPIANPDATVTPPPVDSGSYQPPA